MAKSDLTREIEVQALRWLEEERYQHGVLECMLGYRRQHGIVDILAYHGKSVSQGRGRPRTREVVWSCYEIKVSKQDFYSEHKWSFIGHYNYFILAEGLYEEVREDIPDGVGVYEFKGYKRKWVNFYGIDDPRNVSYIAPVFKSLKRARKQKLKMDEKELMHDYIVSSNRDVRRWVEYKFDKG